MKNALPPIQTPITYRKEKWGQYGELGEGANAKIRFIQTVISQEELDDITLISQIPGSEKWDVRDLFQRDVDSERVKNEILPYLEDKKRVKFFNPLTLVILPMADNSKDILKELEFLKLKQETLENTKFDVFEKKDFYKFSIHSSQQNFAKIQWNDRKCYIVAIDGQHRLSALKRWKKKPSNNADLDAWRIPVVILNIHKVNPKKETANLLEIVRNTFVYINTQAVEVDIARKILLNDESVNAICTQELIQFAHENDNKEIKNRDNNILPLMFFDWRGETKGTLRVQAPASIKNIEEIYSWFLYYIFGDDGSDNQEIQLNLTDLVLRLEGFGPDKTLTHKDAVIIREQFRKTVHQGLSYFLNNFKPYEQYINDCRQIEKESLERSDISQHAFMKLRFGSHNAPEDQFDAVHEEYCSLVNKFEQLKNDFPELINRDIGMRGIIFAYAQAKEEYERIIEKSIEWLEYSKIFITEFNQVFDEGWFNSFDKLEKQQREFLKYIVFDDAGSIINYRLQHAEEALGSLVMILIYHKKWKAKEKTINNDVFLNIWDIYSYNLKRNIEKGFKRYYRSDLKDTFEGTKRQFDLKVQAEAEKATKKRISKMEKYFGLVDA